MFKNLVTLVTGGASGLGLGTVNRFVKKGAKVIVADLSTSKGDSIAKGFGENVEFIPTDISSESDVQNLVNTIESRYGKLNVVVNCAGISNAHILHNFNKNMNRNFDDFIKLIRTNLVGTYSVNLHSVRLIGKNEVDANGLRGVLINTAGIEGIRGHAGQSATAAASRAIMHMTKPLAREFHENGIRVVTIAPGLFKTPLTDFFTPEVDKVLQKDCMFTPNRFGDVDEFAHLAETIVINPSLNACTIDLSAGFNVVLDM